MSVYLLTVMWGEVEHQGQVRQIHPGGQRFVEHPVAPDVSDPVEGCEGVAH